MVRRHELTDAAWATIAPLLPPQTGQRGGRWRDHRTVVNAILWKLKTGVPWRDLPERYQPWQTLAAGGCCAAAASPTPSRPGSTSAAGRPGRPGFDPARYRRRNVVERCVGWLKQWRGIATRYDKLAANYRAGIVICSLLLWLG